LRAVSIEAQVAGAPEVAWFTADLSQPGGAESLVDAVNGSGWTVDALVNNAGAGRSGPWSAGDVEGDRALLRLLVDAPMTLARAWFPGWRARGRGALLNVASTGAFQPGPETSVYYAAKSFLMNWSVALAHEERTWMLVTTLCPGALKTSFSAAAGKRDVPGAPGPDKTARSAIRAWKKNRGLVVPGLINKIVVFVSRILPLAWTAAGVDTLQRAVRKR
jgi:hypothetical protein